MKYFTKLDYPEFPGLLSELQQLLNNNLIRWKFNQICLTTLPDEPNNYELGTGSLIRDWGSTSIIGEDVKVPLKKNFLRESNFTYLCDVFKNTEFENFYNFLLSSDFKFGRIRIIKSEPKTCLSWHRDIEERLHYVLQTNVGAKIVIEDEVCNLPVNTWFKIDSTKYHTAFNGTLSPRIHMVISLL